MSIFQIGNLKKESKPAFQDMFEKNVSWSCWKADGKQAIFLFSELSVPKSNYKVQVFRGGKDTGSSPRIADNKMIVFDKAPQKGNVVFAIYDKKE